MLLRTVARLEVIAALSCALACDPCKDEPDQNRPISDGFEVYERHHPNTGESVRLFFDGETTVYWMTVAADGRIENPGQIQATLEAEALAIVNDAAVQLASGAELGGFNPECLWAMDSPTSTLTVRAASVNLQFRYPSNCPPPLLAALDGLWSDVIASLSTCGASPHYRDCQPSE